MISGSFTTIDKRQTYDVSIGAGLNHTITDPTEGNINSSNMVIMFDTTPVIISCDRQDLLKRIIISQATINLVTNQDLSDYLFAETDRSIPVTITLNDNTCFFGYVDPLQYNQGYAHVWENVQINATDELGALENIYVDDSYFLNKFYIKEGGIVKPKQCKCWDIITHILNKIGITDITISGSIGDYSFDFVYSYVRSAMRNTKLNMSIFFGDSPDDYKNTYEVLEMICKYFNLYVAIYNPHTVIITSTINNQLYENTNIATLKMKEVATDESTSLSTDDAYSQVALTCNIEPVEDIVRSFDDDDYMYSDYDNQVRYMTEYVSNGDGLDSWFAFYFMINGQGTDYKDCYTKDHYMYVLRNDLWDFGSDSNKNYVEYMGGSIDYTTGDVTPMTGNQLNLLTWLAASPCRAALVGFSSEGKQHPSGYTQDNSINNSSSLNKCLIISTMGSWLNNISVVDSYQSILYSAQPICKYRGLSSSTLSPTDERVTNYIVISGSLLFNPLTWLTGPYWETDAARITNDWNSCINSFNVNDGLFRGCWKHSVNINDSWSYYTQYWYSLSKGVYGFLDNSSSKALQYKYSASGDESDTISKLPVLCCQLKVGTGENAKYCCEHLEQGELGINNFEWLTEAEAQAAGVETTFTIGINPKIEDYIIGQKYDISKNIKINKSGMAIPIKYSDNLNGDIEFSILGPYNAIWTEITRIHPTFWRHTSWHQESISILDMCQSIMLSNLKIEMSSDNGGVNEDKTTADNDLVYYSDEITAYTEKLEDDNDICTPLTLDECERWGIKFQTSNSYIFIASNDPDIDGTPFYGFLDDNDIYVKPEECYVDYLFKEYCKSDMSFRPARIIQTQLRPNAFKNGLLGFVMNFDMLTNYFTGLYSLGNCRLMSYEADLKYKTIDATFRQHRTVTNDQI